MKKILAIAIVTFCTFALISGAVSAQTAKSEAEAETSTSGETYSPSKAAMDPSLNHFASDDEVVIDDGYAVPTYKNLSKLYWALAMFDLADNDAIDGYLMINQCDMYKKFYTSDFELESLREATRQSIQKTMAGFPLKFEIMIPIGLDRYNIGTEKFALDPRSQFFGARRLEIAVNSEFGITCEEVPGDPGPKYPRNFILSLSRPLTVTDVPVSPDVAQFYIEKMEEEAPMHGARFALSKYKRIAYLRLTVTMNQFKGYSRPDMQTASMAEVFGTINGFEMYGDRDKTLLMFNQKMAEDRAAKNAKAREISLPAGQLIESKDVDSGGNVVSMSSSKNVINKASPETGLMETPRFDIPSAAAPVTKPTGTTQAKAPVPAPQPAPAPQTAPH